MPFTAQELNNIANAAIDFHMKGKPFDQSIQEKPLLKVLKSREKEFPGGKEYITWRAKGVHTSDIQGYSHDDEVGYDNPANIKRAQANWFEIHSGISFTNTELKKDGISVVDSTTGDKTVEHTEREMTALCGILEDKLDDLDQGWAEKFNLMCWRDGTQDAKLVPGIRSFIRTAPTVGTVFGIDVAANSWYRNRVRLGIVSNSGTWANQPIVLAESSDMRQLRRYQGMKPTHKFAGSDFLDALEGELRAKGVYTQTGWSKSGGIDASMADPSFSGIKYEYDPTLDDEGLSKYCFTLDMKNIQLMPMSGENMKTHAPARPEDKYVFYRAITWTGGLIAKGLRSSQVSSIA
jgi:hypothetical protein